MNKRRPGRACKRKIAHRLRRLNRGLPVPTDDLAASNIVDSRGGSLAVHHILCSPPRTAPTALGEILTLMKSTRGEPELHMVAYHIERPGTRAPDAD